MSSGRSVLWAGALIVVGLVLLLSNLGLLPVDAWRLILPALLIVLGFVTVWAASRPKAPAEVEDLAVARGPAERAQLKVGFGAGRLSLRGGAADPNLVQGRFAGGVALDESRGAEPRVGLTLPSDFPVRFLMPWTWTSGDRLDWDVRLNERVRFDLVVETGASEARLDLRHLQLERFRLACGAASVEVVLPESSGHTRARIESGAASVTVQVPSNVEASIRATSGLAEVRVDPARFPRRGDIYESAGYAGAQDRVEIEIEVGMASVEIR